MTTSQSVTGAVSSISIVPSFSSSEKTRMVMSGIWMSSSSQKSGQVKKICITLCCGVVDSPPPSEAMKRNWMLCATALPKSTT